jgi:Flp pilus assembly pilin Flp
MLEDVALRLLFALQQRLGGSVAREGGQTLAEYSLIISAIAVATVTLSVIAFRGALTDAWNSALPCLTGSC